MVRSGPIWGLNPCGGPPLAIVGLPGAMKLSVPILSGWQLWKIYIWSSMSQTMSLYSYAKNLIGRMWRCHLECSKLVGALFIEMQWVGYRDIVASDDFLCNFAQHNCGWQGWRSNLHTWFWGCLVRLSSWFLALAFTFWLMFYYGISQKPKAKNTYLGAFMAYKPKPKAN